MAVAYRLNCSLSSDEDSDDSDKECFNWKRSLKNEENLEKIPIVSPPTDTHSTASENQTSVKRKRNNIWSEVLEDQMMSETLDVCGIQNKPKDFGSRGAESYDYTLGKRPRDDDGSDEEMLDGHSRSSSANSRKRFRSDKFVEIDNEGQEAAKKIIRVLAEQKAYLIYRIVKYLGIEKAMQLLKKTEEIEENGGLMTQNMQRRRSPGGVYLHLVRSDDTIEKEAMDKIFEGEMNSFELKKKFAELRKKKKKSNKSRRHRNKRNKMECEASVSSSTTPSPIPDDVCLTSSSKEQLMKDSIVMEAAEVSVETDKNGDKNEMSDLEEGEIM